MTTSPIATIVAELARFGVPHTVPGCFASTLHGEPRTTLDMSGDRLDGAYIERWIRELGLQDLWARAQREAR